MKINPPKPEIIPGDPYKNDIFGNRKEFGDSLTSLFTKIDESIVLCIDAQWGDGKTTFAKMWTADLKLHEKICIYYNAFEHDYSEDPFISFSAEILSLLKNEYKDLRIPTGNFKKKVIKIGKMVLPTFSKIALKLLSFGIIEPQLVDSVKGIIKDTSSDVTGLISKTIEEQLGSYNEDKKTITEFRKELEGIGSALKKKTEFSLLIIVDELDRCRPDFALKLIERIKHLFSVDNVSFVLLTNLKQLENHVKFVYGGIDAFTYLQKFITIKTKLPAKNNSRYNLEYYQNYVSYLSKHHELINARYDSKLLICLFEHFSFSLREMEKTMVELVILNLTPEENYYKTEYIKHIISILVIVKIRYFNIYKQLATNQITFSKFQEELRFNQAKCDLKDWVITWIKVFLFSEEEFINWDEYEKYKEKFGSFQLFNDRKDVIPLLCKKLDSISITSSGI